MTDDRIPYHLPADYKVTIWKLLRIGEYICDKLPYQIDYHCIVHFCPFRCHEILNVIFGYYTQLFDPKLCISSSKYVIGTNGVRREFYSEVYLGKLYPWRGTFFNQSVFTPFSTIYHTPCRSVSARKTLLQCVSNGVSSFLHLPINVSS